MYVRCALLSNILSIVNLDWLQHARSVCGMYEVTLLISSFSLSLQCCAITFIENLDAQSLSLSQNEYDDYMSGKALPPGSTNNQPICEGLRMMYANLSALEELRIRQDRLMQNAQEFQQEINDWRDGVVNQVQDVLKNKPLVIKRAKIPAGLDESIGAESEEQVQLPPPLTPEVVNPQ